MCNNYLRRAGIVVGWFVCFSVCLFVISEPAHLDAIAVHLQHG